MRHSMVLKEFMVWDGMKDQRHPIYIWASDADIALQVARMEDRDLDATQWTGRKKEFGNEE